MKPASATTRHLVLVGMMGAGKSSVGRRLSKRVGLPFVDLDKVIERTAGRSIPEIFAAEGEAGFRDREHAALVATMGGPVSIIATGGGAVLREDNRNTMRDGSLVVWLRARPATLATRVGDGTGRPLLEGDPLGKLTVLYEERADAYTAAAHVIVDVDRLSFDAVTSELAALLANHAEQP